MVRLVREKDSEESDRQSQERCRVFKQNRERSRVFAGANRSKYSLTAHLFPKRLDGKIVGDAFKYYRESEHQIIPARVMQLRVSQMSNAFINRHAAAQREDQNRHYQRPEI